MWAKHSVSTTGQQKIQAMCLLCVPSFPTDCIWYGACVQPTSVWIFLKDQASQKEILGQCFHSIKLKVCKLQSDCLKTGAWYEIRGEHGSTLMAAASSASVCLCIFVARAKSCIGCKATEKVESWWLYLQCELEGRRLVSDLTLGGSHVVFSDQTQPCPNEAIIRHPAHLTRTKSSRLISISPTPGTLQKLEQITPLCASSDSDCCYIQIDFQVASCMRAAPRDTARRYTWGLLPKPAEACTQPIAPPDGGQRGPHPLHSPLHAHFHEQSLQLITMIVLSTARLSALEWSFCAIWAPECCQWVLTNCAHKPRRTLICEIPCESDHSRKPRSCHGVSNRSLWSSVSRCKSCQDRETRLRAL